MGVIAKYKFDNTLEANLLPEFNSEFTSDLYTVTDEVDGNATTRTIESDSLPTLMRFGTDTGATDRQRSLLEVYEIDLSNLTTIGLLFGFCINLSKIERLIYNAAEPKIKSMYYAFAHTKITEIDISDIKINADDNNPLHSLFYNCAKLHTIVGLEIFDHKKFKGSYVNTFSSCPSLTSLDLSNWDTSNVTSMQNMFRNCSGLTSLNLSNWNTSNVTNMSNMFYGCTNLTSLDVSNFDTSKVTNMSQMFSCCTNLTSLDVSNFNTSNVTIMNGMFGDCYALISIEGINNFDVRKVQDFGNIFISCHTLQYLDLHNWTTSTDAWYQGMFAYCNNLHTIDISNFIFLGSSGNRRLLFKESQNIKYIKCNNIATIDIIKSQLPTKSSASQGTIICKSDITNLDTTTLQSKYWNIIDEPTLIAKYVFDKSIHNNCIPEFNTGFEGYFIEDEVMEGSSEVTRTIESCGMLPTKVRFGQEWVIHEVASNKSLSLLEVLNINTEQLTTAKDMFRNCANVKNICIHISSKVDSIYGIFENCNKLEKVDVSEWNTSRVTNMYCVFGSCSKLKKVDVSKWDTSQVTNMSYLFLNCYSLTSINVNNFNTSKVTTMSGMFKNCTHLTTLDISNFNTSNVTNITDMLTNTPLLTDISVLYMDKSSLQKLVDAIPTDSNKTLWYKDVNIDGITRGNNITLKKYMEENVEIVLNSPLLEGDTIEVINGKLCHYHKRGMVVFDGSEDEDFSGNTVSDTIMSFSYHTFNAKSTVTYKAYCNNFKNIHSTEKTEHFYVEEWNNSNYFSFYVNCLKLSSQNKDGFKQWLQQNPTTVIYELAEPYYEDITNLQSVPTLKTYLECSMEIDTDLPIDTNITYRTNLSSVYVMERELDELDNGTDLGDILEGEVNE